MAGISLVLHIAKNALLTNQCAIEVTGTKHIRLDVRENIIQDLNLTYTDRMCQIEDTDIAEAVTWRPLNWSIKPP